MQRIFLACVGAAYLLLAAWCVFQPARTSEAVGFKLIPGSGDSEYLVVYGGLQVGLGLVLLRPLLHTADTALCLWICIVIHASLVVFRTASLIAYSGIGFTTYSLAATEWVILISSIAVWLAPVKK